MIWGRKWEWVKSSNEQLVANGELVQPSFVLKNLHKTTSQLVRQTIVTKPSPSREKTNSEHGVRDEFVEGDNSQT